MKPSDVLRKATEKIATPDKWTRGTFARTANGLACSSCDDAAHAFCLLGAIISASPLCNTEPSQQYVFRVISDDDITHWNDATGRTHIEVLAALTKAADLAESEGH